MPENEAGSQLPIKKKQVVIALLTALFFTYLFSGYNKHFFSQLSQLSSQNFHWVYLILALAVIALRDGMYVLRIKHLTDKKLNFKQSFFTILIWEFSSAVTPGGVGGSPVAIYVLNKQGIDSGKSTAIVLITTLFDELFFVFAVLVLSLIWGWQLYIPAQNCYTVAGFNLFEQKYLLWTLFAGVYLFLLFVSFIMFLVIFTQNKWANHLLLKLSKVSFLAKWQRKIVNLMHSFEQAKLHFQNKSVSYWVKTFLFTALSWSARFMLIPALFLLLGGSTSDVFLIFSQMFAIWMLLLLPISPGSSGIAEYALFSYGCVYLSSELLSILVLLWRLSSYYIYLLLGFIALIFRDKLIKNAE